MAPLPTQAASIGDLRTYTDNSALVRKWAQTIMLLGGEDAPEITSLTDESGELIAPIPVGAGGYWPVGITTKEAGITVASEVETDEAEGLGYVDAVAEEIDKVTRTLSFSPFETMKWQLWAISHGVPIEPRPQMAANGEVVIDSPSFPVVEVLRGIRISASGSGDKLLINGTFFPRLLNKSISEETFGASWATAPLELTISTDTTLGFPRRDFHGGPGMLTYRDALGYGGGSTAAGGAIPVV